MGAPLYRPVRMTMATKAVLRALLDGASEDLYGLAVMEWTRLGSGVVYPILTRLEERGWVEARWEADQPAGRPRRCYYKLTTWGAWRARKALEPKEKP